MLDLGWSELLVVAVIGLIVIGPRDLPRALYTVGKWARSIRRMGQKFQDQIDDVVQEAELEDVKKGVQTARKGNLSRQAKDYVKRQADPDGELDEAARSLNPQADVDADTVRANVAQQKAREAGSAPTPAAEGATGAEAHLADTDPPASPDSAAESGTDPAGSRRTPNAATD